MSNSNALRQDAQIFDTIETTDFGRFALGLLMELDTAHPSRVDLMSHNEVSAEDTALRKFWFYLAHQGIISGELTECSLTPEGRRSLHAALARQCENGSNSLSSAQLLSGKPASSLLLDVMRHNFLLQADTDRRPGI